MAEPQQVNINDSDDAVITRLQKTISNNEETVTYFAPFGADDNNVQMYVQDTNNQDIYNKWGSLRNFFQEWLNFKKIWKQFTQEAQFIQYSSEEPISNNVKIWFELPEDSD